ncbi:hypothetical protein [Streptomyces sp. SYP-A7185]|uniref:hypothetical protein n=1 Tax=Streptomyces sp. SYP-A7185 TaxID=3040076 RepID=UPI0038F6627D
MDQAVAALCGAGIGVVGTVGASWLTYVGTRRQAPDQGRIEHARQLRTERREAYLSFMELLEPMDHVPTEAPAEVAPEQYAGLDSQLQTIRTRGESLLARIQLCGPAEIIDPASGLLGSAVRVAHLFLSRSQEQEEIDLAFESFVDAQTAFIVQARHVMLQPPD